MTVFKLFTFGYFGVLAFFALIGLMDWDDRTHMGKLSTQVIFWMVCLGAVIGVIVSIFEPSSVSCTPR